MAHNAILHSPMKHIKTKYHLICDLVLENKVELIYVPSRQQKANIFTKSMGNLPSLIKCKHCLTLIEIEHVD